MKKLLATVFAVLGFFPLFAQGQQAPTDVSTAALPASLSGSWMAADKTSGRWEVTKIDIAAQSGLLTFSSAQPRCDITAAPVKVTYDGNVLKVLVRDEEHVMPCSESFFAELKRNGNAFAGKIWPGITGARFVSVATIIK